MKLALYAYTLFACFVVIWNLTKAKRFRLTWVGVLNVLVCQWFFVRLGRVSEIQSGRHIGWTFLRGVVPCTGWWSRFVFVQEFFPCRPK